MALNLTEAEKKTLAYALEIAQEQAYEKGPKSLRADIEKLREKLDQTPEQ